MSILASIISKKVAESLDALVLDVKVGKGAFLKEEQDARELGKRMVNPYTDRLCETRTQYTHASFYHLSFGQSFGRILSLLCFVLFLSKQLNDCFIYQRPLVNNKLYMHVCTTCKSSH